MTKTLINQANWTK